MSDIPFLGCKISLISKCDIRYEGILYSVDAKESTIALSKVKSYGTETRGDPSCFVAPKNDVYDIIIFRASDVKDLRVDARPEPPGLSDPAIISINNLKCTGQSAPSTSSIFNPSNTSNNSTSNNNATNTGAPTLNSNGSRSPSGPSNQQKRPQQQRQQQQPKPLPRPRREGNRGGAPNYRGGGGGGGVSNYRSNAPNYRDGPNNYRGGPNNHRGGPPNHRGDANNHRSGAPNHRGPPNHRRGPPPGGPRKSAPLEFGGEYDFEEANKIFLHLEGKLKNMKLKDDKDEAESSGDRANSKSLAAQSVSGSGYDSEDQKDGDSKEDGAGSASGDFYDKTKSFFDNISCEASERGQGRTNKPNWRKERELNTETFGVSGNYRRGGYRNRSYGANGYHRR